MKIETTHMLYRLWSTLHLRSESASHDSSIFE